MTFWTASETNTEEHCLWLAHFFSLSDALSSCVWSTDPVFLKEHRFSVKCHSYLFYHSRNRERKISLFLVEEKANSLFRVKSWLINAAVLAVIFCSFISHLIGRETINIPEIFFGVHGFTGKTVNNMSMQGTWCDALFVQAVAECQNVAIHII